MEKKVVLWSSYTCQLCTDLKQFFDEHQIAYENQDMKKDDSLRDIIEAKYGIRKAPVVEVDDDVVIGGGQWSEENWKKLKELLNLSETVK